MSAQPCLSEKEEIICAFIGEHPATICEQESRDDSSQLVRSTMRNLSETDKILELDRGSIEYILELGGASIQTIRDVINDYENIKGPELSVIVEDFRLQRAPLDSTVDSIISLHQTSKTITEGASVDSPHSQKSLLHSFCSWLFNCSHAR